MSKDKWKFQIFMVALGQTVSLLGSYGVQFALIWWLAERTGSPMMLGLSGLVAYLPMTLLSPAAGVLADRFNRKYICILSDMSMGIAALIYAGLLYLFELPVWTVLVILCVRGIGGTFQQPAIQSIIPQLVPKEALIKTNGWMQLMNAGSFFLGPVIGGILYAAVPMPVILLTDVVGAVLASLALAMVIVPPLEKMTNDKNPMLKQFREGLSVFKADRRLFYLVVGQALCMFFYAPLSSFYPLMTSDYFKLSALHGSIVETAFAAGMMLASLLFSSILTVTHKIRVSWWGLIGMGLVTAACGLVPDTFSGWLLFAGLCAALGAVGNIHSIPLTAYMQETIEAEKMGRAFSVLTLISSVAMPAGLLLGSPVAEKVGVSAWFLVSGAGMLLLTGGVLVYRWIQGKREEWI